MTANPVVWFEIDVADLARARRFCETVLGVTLSKLDSPDDDTETWSFPMQPDGGGAGTRGASIARSSRSGPTGTSRSSSTPKGA
jgi:predicted enzyme related to lactoylglutathione lyase